MGAMYSAVMFLGGTNTNAVQSVVAIERTVFYREKAAGMYSPLPYAFAQVNQLIPQLLVEVTCKQVKYHILGWREYLLVIGELIYI